MNWNTLLAGLLSGFLTAAAVDYSAFRSWKSWDDAQRYDWKLASWRWFQGCATGVAVALGWSVAIGN